MKSCLLIICILFVGVVHSQSYNLVPCPDFECVEYVIPINPTVPFCSNYNSTCCHNYLYILDSESGEEVPILKYEEFYCGPWEFDTKGEEPLDIPYRPTLCSSTIDDIYSSTSISNYDANYWSNDNSNLCTTPASNPPLECIQGRYLCPSEFSIPTNTFGTQGSIDLGVENNNYVGFRATGLLGRSDGIKVKLTEAIAPCVTYVFECDVVRKTNNETKMEFRLTSDGDWADDNGGIESISIDNNHEDNAEWQHIYREFSVEEASDWLHIRLKRSFQGVKTALFDNIKLYRKCDKERDEFSCVSFDPSIGNVTVNELHTTEIPFTVFNLGNLDFVSLIINTSGGQNILTTTIFNPPSNISWNGKNQNGDELADGTYAYSLTFAHGCSPACIQTGTFAKAGTYIGILNPEVNTANGLLTITGLQNSTYFNIRIFQNNVLVRNLSINNPLDVISWDGKDDSGNDLNAGTYQYMITVVSPCDRKEFIGEFVKNSTTIDSPNFNYTAQPRNLTIGNCGYNFNPRSIYYKPPVPCCVHEPDILIQNTLLDGDLLIAVTGTITIGNGVQITPGSNITFQAGEGIEGLANLEFEAQDGASYTISQEPCVMRLANTDEREYSKHKNVIKSEVSSSLIISPNPTRGFFRVSSAQAIIGEKIEVYSIDGRRIPFSISSVNDNYTEVQMSTDNCGVYIILVHTDKGIFSEKVVLTNFK